MALGWTRTQRHRKIKLRTRGAKGRRARDNQGSTAKVPLEGPLPALRYGMKIKPEKIVISIKA